MVRYCYVDDLEALVKMLFLSSKTIRVLDCFITLMLVVPLVSMNN